MNSKFALAVLGTYLFLQGNLAFADNLAIVTMADQPLRVIRGASVYKAANGVPVQKDDIVESDSSGAQIEAGTDFIVSLGPQTKLYLISLPGDGQATTELALLQGWIKLRSKATKTTVVIGPSMRISLTAGASIVHSTQAKDDMFAEDGNQAAAAMGDKGRFDADTKVLREQYAVVVPGQAVKILPRPAKDFLADMPIVFRDPIAPAPNTMKGSKLAAHKERDVDYADIDAWLNCKLQFKKNFVSRFSPRLKDPGFRKQLDQQLGHSSEWEPILHPRVEVDKKKETPQVTHGSGS